MNKYLNKINVSEYFSRHKSSLLSSLDIELTERCNNKCIHCYINQQENDSFLKAKELSTSRLKEIINEAADLGCMKIKFTGGEPLLRNDFKELYLYTRKKGIKVTLFTNGTLIDEEMAELWNKYPPGEKIEITLYGTNSKFYEQAAGVKGGFEKAIRGISLLKEKNIPFIVKGIYFQDRHKDAASLNELSKSIPYMEHLPSYSLNFDLRARRDSEKKNKFIKNLRVSPEMTIEFLTKSKESFVTGMQEFASKFMKPPGELLFNCGCGKGGAVDAYGKFQPCLLLRHPDAVYDLDKGCLEDALENFFTDLRKLKPKNSEYLNKCAKCFLKGLCENCPAKSWMEHGLLDSPVKYYCDIAHEKARFLGLLEQDEFGWEVKEWEKRIESFCSQ